MKIYLSKSTKSFKKAIQDAYPNKFGQVLMSFFLFVFFILLLLFLTFALFHVLKKIYVFKTPKTSPEVKKIISHQMMIFEIICGFSFVAVIINGIKFFKEITKKIKPIYNHYQENMVDHKLEIQSQEEKNLLNEQIPSSGIEYKKHKKRL